jgi:hypothetical protein
LRFRTVERLRAVVRKHGLEQRFSDAMEREVKPVRPMQEEFWPGAKKPARSA